MRYNALLITKVFMSLALTCCIGLSEVYGASEHAGDDERSSSKELGVRPKIQFDEPFHDLGKVMQNKTVEHIFTFKNVGTGLLRIQKKIKSG